MADHGRTAGPARHRRRGREERPDFGRCRAVRRCDRRARRLALAGRFRGRGGARTLCQSVASYRAQRSVPVRQRQEVQELPSGGGMKQPNIVFIMADDLGYADLSCNGRRDYSTPNIDRIAERGICLRQAYANSAVCSATRLALITGRYQYRLPLGLEEPLAGKTDVGLPPRHPTLPSLLRQSGYGTTLIGKWHLGTPPKFGPSRSGYDRFFGIRS